ncbi:tRNA (N(6)-L-threonylcarbamoyladenosine(37)-C(2))-methylthiotransferase MtaB [Capillibacterium thermochitinicola]|uniref:Threonylcarbamoyladenosine tRNA methylthiotransferase MtaB n=1 Tax=Capillibacterium thermochitinicola TaxID=2699427 RepID=A0A8J6HZE4_9FIRM|nr:tRNA (N(6)-L-threonylcarbamoyladenosine(37)-C(2))-methylthiotransferase MtaB [Capillibacterium thermochitinicola]MBA2132448.1 tRNA (N(6)-L-threonylcarbamoyladenosine(37)-C(2))-methylthiotransferase MtaB [Capillibacterium thermochitinicola]
MVENGAKEEKAKDVGQRPARKIAFYTLGCKVNQFDTEGLITESRAHGYEVVSFDEPAAIYVLNTCTVTKEAERKARQLIRRVKRKHPDAFLVVTGCFAQTGAEVLTALPEVDLVVGVAGRGRLFQILEEELTVRRKNRVLPWAEVDGFEVFAPEFSGQTRAFLKVEDGCQSYCSYCKIPFARGPVRSLPLPQVMKEIERLLALGYKEIVLVGIHLGHYGIDLGTNLASLLARIEQEWGGTEPKWRLRLGSVDPTDFTPQLMEVILSSTLLCNHLHIPLQSGSGKVLSLMNRNYSPDDYAGLVTLLRNGRPGLALTTDLMVGFPGETEADFNETLNFIQAIGFSKVHIFPYSLRPGTRAAQMKGHLPRWVKEERVKRAEAIARTLAHAYWKRLLDQVVEVLIEETNRDGYGEGLAREYVRVQVKEMREPNTMVHARIIQADREPLTGVVVEA